MKRTGFAFALGLLVLAGSPAVSAEEHAGKKIFLDNKCQACHTVESQGIKAEEGEPADAAEDKDSPKPPDLSDVGTKVKADFLDKYLVKKETIEGRKHRKSFKGTDADRKTLISWLMTLTAKPAAAK